MNAARTLIFAGGGTGGHIFPALAIAEQARKLAPGVRCIFVCSHRPLDSQILTKEGAEFRVVPAMPFGVRPRALVRFARSWGPSIRAGRALIRECRASGSDVRVIAMGGFVAAPIAHAAVAERATLLLVNMDAIPGKANRWIARKADRIVTSAPVEGEPWERIPPIVRAAALASKDAGECRRALGMNAERQTLLVTGASQGAKSINQLLISLVDSKPDVFRDWQVIHQTGANEEAGVRRAYEAAGVPALVQPFFDGMGLAWGAADLAVSRAGAGSVAEAWANAVPTIFLPYPYHKDQHQRFNAGQLVEAGAAVLNEDLIDAERNLNGAGMTLALLMTEPQARVKMKGAFGALGPANGAERIARIIVGN